jgi:hypothetical protein
VKGGGAVKHNPLHEASVFEFIVQFLVPMVIMLGSIIAAGYYGRSAWLQALIMIFVAVVGDL